MQNDESDFDSESVAGLLVKSLRVLCPTWTKLDDQSQWGAVEHDYFCTPSAGMEFYSQKMFTSARNRQMPGSTISSISLLSKKMEFF